MAPFGGLTFEVTMAESVLTITLSEKDAESYKQHKAIYSEIFTTEDLEQAFIKFAFDCGFDDFFFGQTPLDKYTDRRP